MSEELLNCPFCGAMPPTVAVYSLQHPIVWCRQCGAQTSAKATFKDAIAAWNRRTNRDGLGGEG